MGNRPSLQEIEDRERVNNLHVRNTLQSEIEASVRSMGAIPINDNTKNIIYNTALTILKTAIARGIIYSYNITADLIDHCISLHIDFKTSFLSESKSIDMEFSC